MTRIKLLLVFLFNVLLIAGCGHVQSLDSATSAVPKKYSYSASEENDSRSEKQITQDGVNAKRHVIYNAKIELTVVDFEKFERELPTLVNDSGGYVADVSLRHEQNYRKKSSYRTGVWTVKVLSTEFDKFMDSLSETGFIVKHDQTAEDVTDQYVDLTARISNKKRMESRVLEILDESGHSLNDVISLEAELSRIREEIERMQGQLNVLKNRTRFATVTVKAIEEDKVVAATRSPLNERVSSSWASSISLLSKFAGNALVMVVSGIPWAVVGLILTVVMLYFCKLLYRLFRWGNRTVTASRA